MQVEIIKFKAADGVMLDGFLHKNHTKRVVIATHGMNGNCFRERDKIIAQKIAEGHIDFFIYNNRGSELVRTLKKEQNGEITKILAGTTYEDVEEGYYDIKGAIMKSIEMGYTEIYLQGHSLGSTKTLYTYHKLQKENSEILSYIKGMLLLSLVDIPRVLRVHLGKNFPTFLQLAEEKEKTGREYDIMPNESFIYPISVKTFLKYAKYYKTFDFAQYSNSNFTFNALNNISVPLFMRWGNVNEMVEQRVEILTQMLNTKINKKDKDICFIDGANHNYTDKENILAKEILNFLKQYDD